MLMHTGEIRYDSGLQVRVAIDTDTVDSYADLLKADMDFDFPPVVVFHDGEHYWLADGFHRKAAYGSAQRFEIPVDVRKGTKRDALKYALGANKQHGLRRTNADKRRAVQIALADEEWGKWSNVAIGDLCGVDETTVRKAKLSLRENRSDNSDPSTRTYRTKHGTTATMDTSRIGRRNKNVTIPLYASAREEAEEEEAAAESEELKNLRFWWGEASAEDREIFRRDIN